MKRLLITVFSTGLLLSTVQVRPDSQIFNWTKNELSKVAWGQGASAVANDAKAVGSYVYAQLPSKEAVKDMLVSGKEVAQKALNSGKSFVKKEPFGSFVVGLAGLASTALALSYANDSYATPEQKELSALWEISYSIECFKKEYDSPVNTYADLRVKFQQLLDKVNASEANLLSVDVKHALNNLKTVINSFEFKSLASGIERKKIDKALEDFQVSLKLEYGKIKKDSLSKSVVIGSLLPSLALMGYALYSK